jgi:hypothetical protein
MKKFLYAAAMVAGFAMSANAGGLVGGAGGAVGGAVGGLGGAVGGVGNSAGSAVGGIAGSASGIGGAVGGIGSSVTGNVDASVSGGANGQVGTVVSNVAHFGIKTTASTNVALSAASDLSTDIRQINTLESVGAISLVDVSTLANADADASVSNALAQTTSGAAKIQEALTNNANVMMAIMAENPDFDVSSVVSVDVRANNELVIYTN